MSVLEISRDGAVAHWILNQPDRFNPLSDAMFDALESAMGDAEGDDALRAVVISARGKAFCAGHDLREVRGRDEEAAHRALFDRCSAFMRRIVALPVPVIAQVEGIATAAGCQLVATCDMAVASTDARFAVSGVRLGLFCSTPSVALRRVVSQKRAFEMLATGDFIDASTAADWGLVNRAVPPEEVGAAVAALTDSICAKSRTALAMGKGLLGRQDARLAADYDDASATMAANMAHYDAREGIDAFLEKRPMRPK